MKSTLILVLLIINSFGQKLINDIEQNISIQDDQKQEKQNRLIVIQQKTLGLHNMFIKQQQLDFSISLIQNLNGKVIFNHESNSKGGEGHFQYVNVQPKVKEEINEIIQGQKEYYRKKYPNLIESRFLQSGNYLRNEHKYNKLNLKSTQQQIAQQKQLPFCILIPSFNNAQKQFYIKNINSILQQQYTNYHIVYMDDASQDNTTQHVIQFLKETFPSHKLLKEWKMTQNQTSQINIITVRDFEFNKIKWKFVQNQKRRKAMFNIYHGALSFCQDNQIVILIDGDDAFVGSQTLKMMNRVYTQTQAMFVYTSYTLRKDIQIDRFRTYKENQDILESILKKDRNIIRHYNEDLSQIGHHSHKNLDKVTTYEIGPAGYELVIKLVEQQKLRTIPYLLASHILSFYTSLLRKAPIDNFMGNNNRFMDYGYDTALTLTLSQLACKRTFFFKEIMYEYTANTGINDSPENWARASHTITRKQPNQSLTDDQAKKMVKKVLFQ